MLIYKLTPTEKTSDHWRASSYKGDVVIRAEDEDEARNIAKLKFLKAVKRISKYQDTPISPWSDSDLVKCERLENSDYDENGLAGVLFPKSNMPRR